MGNCNDSTKNLVYSSQSSNQLEVTKEMEQQLEENSTLNIKIIINTWTKHQQGLYDYEDVSNKQQKSVDLLQSCCLDLNTGDLLEEKGLIQGGENLVYFTKEREISWLKLGSEKNFGRVTQFGVEEEVIQQRSEEGFQKEKDWNISSLDLDEEKSCFLVVSSYQVKQEKGYELKKGDCFKLGRVLIRLHEVCATQSDLQKKSDFFESGKVSEFLEDDFLQYKQNNQIIQSKSAQSKSLSQEDLQSKKSVQKNFQQKFQKYREEEFQTNNNIYQSEVVKVKKIKDQNSNSEEFSSAANSPKSSGSSKKDLNLEFEQKNLPNCRFCLSENVEEPDFVLIQPCACKGSVASVHVQCLRQWIQCKQKSQEDKKGKVIAFISRNLQCELCKENFSYKVKQNGTVHNLFSLERPKQPYFILEIKSQHNKNKQLGFLVLKIDGDDTFKIGRSHNCEINFNDISVSRNHATLQFQNGKIFLTDNKSKFGTLLLLQNDLPITREMDNMSFQIGRHLIKFNTFIRPNLNPKGQTLKTNSNQLGCCHNIITTSSSE